MVNYRSAKSISTVVQVPDDIFHQSDYERKKCIPECLRHARQKITIFGTGVYAKDQRTEYLHRLSKDDNSYQNGEQVKTGTSRPSSGQRRTLERDGGIWHQTDEFEEKETSRPSSGQRRTLGRDGGIWHQPDDHEEKGTSRPSSGQRRTLGRDGTNKLSGDNVDRGYRIQSADDDWDQCDSEGKKYIPESLRPEKQKITIFGTGQLLKDKQHEYLHSHSKDISDEQLQNGTSRPSSGQKKRILERDAGDRSDRRYQNAGTTKSSSESKHPDHFEQISVPYATKQGNIRLLRALAAKSTKGLAEFGHSFPLHTAVSLGMKRTTSFLLQSGFDLEERNESHQTPIQYIDHRQDSVLYEYIRKLDGSPPSPEQPSVTGVIKRPVFDETVYFVNMERVDLSTRTVYLPSAQFRSTFKDRDPSRRMFFVSPFLSEYSMVCTYQMYGLLWLLGRYNEEDYLHCLDDIILPEKDLLRFNDGSTGKFDFRSWINGREKAHIYKEKSIDNGLGPESMYADNILHDGWTPMHHAVLTRNDEFVKQLLDSGEGHSASKTYTLLPKFILDQLKTTSVFEYEFVYSHIEGFTPLMLAIFTENQTAIELIGQCIETQNIFNGKDISDCLALAYCEDAERILLDVLCRIGEKHVTKIHNVSVNLQPFYRKKNPMERILFGSSTDVIETIEEDFFTVKIIVENKTIIKEYMSPGNIDEVPEEEDKLLEETIRLHSDRLWKRHSSLNAIMPGHVSSLPHECPGYHKSVMVVFHSTDKEFIPASELPFQEYLLTNGERVLVHVIEGSFRFAPTIPTAQVGRSIDYEKFRASLGTFVESSQKQKGMLTCAHTFLRDFLDSDAVSCDRAFDLNTSPEVLRVYEVERKRLTVYKEDRTSAEENSTTISTAGNAMDIAYPHSGSCGYVKRLLFRPDKEVFKTRTCNSTAKNLNVHDPYVS